MTNPHGVGVSVFARRQLVFPRVNNHVELHGTASGSTDGAVLDFFGLGQSTAGSVWQDASGNMNIASQVANSSININVFGTGMVAINSPIKNPNIPTSAPSSGAHFVCIDDAGDMYRSDTACK